MTHGISAMKAELNAKGCRIYQQDFLQEPVAAAK